MSTAMLNNNPRESAAIAQLAAGRAAAAKPQAAGRAIPQQLATIVRPAARDRWLGSVAGSYDPQRIEQVLRSAMTGQLTAQWELFDLMLDTWPRLLKNQGELIRAVQSYERNVEPWFEEDEAPTPEAEERAKLASRALWTMSPKPDEDQNGYDQMIFDIMEAWFKGVSVQEITWEVRDGGKFGSITAPQSTRWIHPRYYGYSSQANWLGLNVSEINQTQTGSTVAGNGEPTLTLTPADGVYARFPENKFLICVCKAKSGHASVSALLRPLAFWWAATNFTQQWFLNFAQIFGMPIRWATYDPNTPGLVDNVLDMLENMGSAAYAAFPAGTTLELKEPMKAGTDNPQAALLDRADLQCDILILGQTLTTSTPAAGGGTRAQGEVHFQVRGDIIEAAANYVSSVINQQLIPAIIWLNYGDKKLMPEVCLAPKTLEDTKANAETLKVASDIGVKIPASHASKKLGIPLPTEGEEILEPRSSAAPGGFGAQTPQPADAVQAHARAHNEATDKLVDNTLEKLTGVQARWLGGLKPEIHRLIVLAQSEKVSDADFVQALAKAQKQMPELFSKIKPEELEEALYDAMSAGVVNGALRGAMKHGKVVAA